MLPRLPILISLLLFSKGALALSLIEAYQTAVSNDAQFQAAIEAQSAGQENRSIGRSGLLPTIAWQYSHSENTSTVSGKSARIQRDYHSYASTLSVEQPIVDFAAWAGYKQGDAQALQADEQFREQQQALIVRLVAAYSETLLAVEKVRLAESKQRAYAERLALNQRLLKAGEGTRTDILETQARLQLATTDTMEAELAVDSALNQLEIMIGKTLFASDIRPLARTFSPLPLIPDNVQTWCNLARQHSPTIAALNHEIDVFKYAFERNRAGYLPRVNLFARTRQTSSDTETSYQQQYDTNSIGVEISLPIFSGGQTTAVVQQASHQLLEAQHQLDAEIATIFSEVKKQFNQLKSTEARLNAYQLAVDAAELTVHATQKSVQGGERVNADVLDAEQRLVSARQDLLEAQHRWLLAWVNIRHQAGTLSEKDILVLSDLFQPSARQN